jgi:polysaccharide biosynthesis protein PslH
MAATGPSDKPAVLFITNGDDGMRFGGAALRYAALENALRLRADVLRYPVRCPSGARCNHSDAVTRTPALPFRNRPIFYDGCCAVAMAGLRRTAERIRPAVVVASGLETWRYLHAVRRYTTAATILDLHNAESVLSHEIAKALRIHPDGEYFGVADGDDLRLIEADALSWVDHLWVCTAADAARIGWLHDYPETSITVVPNAVVPRTGTADNTPVERLLFLGRFDWFPNYVAAEFLLDEVVPRLSPAVGAMPLLLAGAHPPPPLRRRSLPPSARLIGDPPTVEPLWRSSVLAVPLTLGGGSRLKILEAFAAGRPVVSSAKGMEGIDAIGGTHYLPADTAGEMVEAVHALATDDSLRARLTANGARLLRGAHTPAQLAGVVSASLRRLGSK